jgi:very-short-patch-repair endonuclease
MSIDVKGQSFLRFLRDAVALRRKRQTVYGVNDRILWLSDVPRERVEIRTPFLQPDVETTHNFWLEVKKAQAPIRPPAPAAVVDWIRSDSLDSADHEPELLSEITVLVEEFIPDPDSPPGVERQVAHHFPKRLLLADHPEVEEAWLEYIINQWQPWSDKRRRWEELQRVYESVDFMRRRLEEAEEKYELILGIGLIQWRDSTGKAIKRHLLTGPADLSFDAARGIITVTPAASFVGFRVELDMLELHDQPRLEAEKIEQLLEELEIQAWDHQKVGVILREIANRVTADSQVDVETFEPAKTEDNTFRITFAPALILRERRLMGFDDIVRKFLKKIEDEDGKEGAITSTPWEIFLSEGGGPDGGDLTPEELIWEAVDSDEQLYFPLPTNEEQRQIVYRLKALPCVVVKGPPGTGKSHTIANLISHLLALGERVLVTAEAPKALAVLRGLLPQGFHDICLTALGSSREDQRLLEEGVRGILKKKNEHEHRGESWFQEKLGILEDELKLFKGELARVDRQLLESREAETFTHHLVGGYEGTAARIVRRLEEEKADLGWFPYPLFGQPAFPIREEEVLLMSEVHCQLTSELETELALDLGDFSLPMQEEVRLWIIELEDAEEKAERAAKFAEPEKLRLLQAKPQEALEQTATAIKDLEEHIIKATRSLGSITHEIIQDALAYNLQGWGALRDQVNKIIEKIESNQKQLDGAKIILPPDMPFGRALEDASRRLAHFQGGGRRGFWLFSPRVIRETSYLEKQCTVDGVAPRENSALEKVFAFLSLSEAIDKFSNIWPEPLDRPGENLEQQALVCKTKALELNSLLEFCSSPELHELSWLPPAQRVNLAEEQERTLWRNAIEAALAQRQVEAAIGPINDCLEKLRQVIDTGKAHPIILKLKDALERRSPADWHSAFEQWEQIHALKVRAISYYEILHSIEEADPALAGVIKKNQGNPVWRSRLLNLERAWYWAAARGWLDEVLDRDRYEDLIRRSHQLREKIENKIEKIAELRAWDVFIKRLDRFTMQNLDAWTKAVDRIGKGTGKYAYRNRRAAQEYLLKCIPKIPSWIMPLHKLWDTVAAEPGLFDTIIIDEASQAGIEALLLLLLAKRIIVVGDDKQNSPEAVGIQEDDIARLQREHLREFHFRAEFRPDTSLFDHAVRSFGNLVSLREHFRCVPEIIRFSNDLCYREAPLIPLRQAPPDRLPPLCRTFVPEGACEGMGARIQNLAEAEVLVKTVESCLKDKAYEGKTMGVIVLQGQAQAMLIERLLNQSLDPEVLEEHKLRCGVPSTFQGDQRDVIFLSLVMAPNGKYVSLTRLPYQRRYNVAMSRARDQVWLFHSVQVQDLGADCLRRRLLDFCQRRPSIPESLYEERERLEQELRRSPHRLGEQPEPYESWFEVEVALELMRRNYRVRPQYEVAGKFIDLVVEGLEARLAVECDGDAWHGPEHYEQDMARQRQLERAGWTFARIRESEFYVNRERALREIIQACDELGISPASIKPIEEEVGLEPQVTQPSEPKPEEVSLEPEEISDEPEGAESGPFSGYSPDLNFPDPRQAVTANVRAALRQIVKRDGPLTRASIYSLYAKGCPFLQRVTRGVQEMLNRALAVMLRAKEILQVDELGGSRPEGLVIRLAGTPSVVERPAGRRALNEIPPSELFLIFDRVLAQKSLTNKEETEWLFRTVLDYYGFTKLTQVRWRHLERLLKTWQEKRVDDRTYEKAQNLKMKSLF